jgi:hypothetical protein
MLSTTTGPLAEHVHTYLGTVGLAEVTAADFGRWWRIRGKLAHGTLSRSIPGISIASSTPSRRRCGAPAGVEAIPEHLRV